MKCGIQLKVFLFPIVPHSLALGQGWRLGFLGLLHMDVFKQRLEQVCMTGIGGAPELIGCNPSQKG